MGGKLSEESKKIISEKNKINSKNFLSKTTKEQRSKLYGSSKGKIWYYDPNTFKRYYGFKETQPAGYIKGFIKNINKWAERWTDVYKWIFTLQQAFSLRCLYWWN